MYHATHKAIDLCSYATHNASYKVASYVATN